MKTIAAVCNSVGVALIGGLAVAMPYVIYIAVRYSILDPRLNWVPLGAPGVLMGLLLLRIGTALGE